ncbi:hypothetical protein [Flavobacterium sp. I3-2]|uniref:hypothetical protein n=1 Tax=Flavobacterium sp. I3-2 TaxID=2748319 RepID=UPI0015B27527|nr:hypothetical protein [Flavobacterium sp. I3-2]
MKKIFLSLSAIALLAVGTVSCGGDDSSSPVIVDPVDDTTPDDTTPGTANIVIGGTEYKSSFGYFTVYGNETTGAIEGTYTWTPEELGGGATESLLVSEWSSFEILNRTDAGSYYILLTSFDVPMIDENQAGLPNQFQGVLSYGQKLYYVASQGATPSLVSTANNQTANTSFSTFALGQFGQTENGDAAHQVTNYAFTSAFGYSGTAAPGTFNGTGSLLYVETKTASKSNSKEDRFERAIKSFDINRVK